MAQPTGATPRKLWMSAISFGVKTKGLTTNRAAGLGKVRRSWSRPAIGAQFTISRGKPLPTKTSRLLSDRGIPHGSDNLSPHAEGVRKEDKIDRADKIAETAGRTR